jgi:hypothetical protein
MKTTKSTTTVAAISVLSLIGWLCPSTTRADVMESARMLPDDTLVMVSVESVSGLRAALEKTSLFGLYKDPAMQPLVKETEKKIREGIDEAIKDLWKKLEMETPPEQIPYPEGRVVLGLSVFAMKAADSGARPPAGEKRGFRLALVADMGSRADQVRQIARSLSTSAANAGTTIRKQEVAGIELNVIVPKEDSDEPTIRYGLKDNWLLVTVDMAQGAEFTESVARRMGRSLPGSLAERSGFQSAAKALGDAHIFAFVNADALKSLILETVPNRPMIEQMIKSLGFDNVAGMATAVQFAGQRNQDMSSRSLIAITGTRTGIPALLTPPSAPLKLNNRFMTQDIVGFVSANYEPLRLYDGIAKIASEAMSMDLNMFVQMAMSATAGEAGQPPVRLRDDVLAQMAGPLFVTWHAEKPYTLTESTRFLVGLPVQDAGRLNTALGRIHQAFLQGQPGLRRELLEHTIYLLPTGGAPAGFGDDEEDEHSSDDEAATESLAAFSVAGDNLVIGQVDEVEQAIRRLRKAPENPLTSDPMFRYAREFLPSQAGLYSYQNDRLNMEVTWTALQQMIRDLSKQDDASWNPMLMFLQKAREFVDLNKLPEFKAVQKYWGATVGYLQNRPEGIYWESITLRPPQQ